MAFEEVSVLHKQSKVVLLSILCTHTFLNMRHTGPYGVHEMSLALYVATLVAVVKSRLAKVASWSLST